MLGAASNCFHVSYEWKNVKLKKQYFLFLRFHDFTRCPDWWIRESLGLFRCYCDSLWSEYPFAHFKWAPWGDFSMCLSGINHSFFSGFYLIMFVAHQHKAIGRGAFMVYERTRGPLRRVVPPAWIKLYLLQPSLVWHENNFIFCVGVAHRGMPLLTRVDSHSLEEGYAFYPETAC